MRLNAVILVASILLGSVNATIADTPNDEKLLRTAVDNWCAQSSVTEMAKTVHRLDWERSMQLKAWTRADNTALVRFTAPAKIAGNATLIICLPKSTNVPNREERRGSTHRKRLQQSLGRLVR